MATKEFWTVAEVAELLGVHRETVRRWIRNGWLEAIDLGSTRAGLRIPNREVDRVRRNEFIERTP